MKYNGVIENKLRLIEQTLPDYLEMVKFRNFIVHRYERIDLEIIYAILKSLRFNFTYVLMFPCFQLKTFNMKKAVQDVQTVTPDGKSILPVHPEGSLAC